MANRVEDRLGEAASVGTTYTIVGAAVASATTWNLVLQLVNRTTSLVKVRAYAADNSWSSGEPTGGTLKHAICYDLELLPGGVQHLSGIVMKTTEKLVVRSDTASSLDVAASGVKVT